LVGEAGDDEIADKALGQEGSNGSDCTPARVLGAVEIGHKGLLFSAAVARATHVIVYHYIMRNRLATGG
jgi:hypothetical protein